MKIRLFLLLFFCFQLLSNSTTTLALEPVNPQEQLQQFSSQAQKLINEEISFDQFDGVIPTRLVNRLVKLPENDSSVANVMLKFLPLASHYALPVTSNFYVGAVTQGKSGALYFGANLEIAGESLGNSIHAEQSAVNNALLHGEKGIIRIAITAAPCGHCRQFLNEINQAAQIEVIVQGNQAVKLPELLPQSFGPVDLGSTNPLFAPTKANLATNAKLCKTATQEQHSDCSHSYAPHTGSLSTVMLHAGDDIQVLGTYIENAAYNPSLSPLLSALDQLRYRQRDFSQITEVKLVELNDAKISQQTHVTSILNVIAPQAKFERVTITDN